MPRDSYAAGMRRRFGTGTSGRGKTAMEQIRGPERKRKAKKGTGGKSPYEIMRKGL